MEFFFLALVAGGIGVAFGVYHARRETPTFVMAYNALLRMAGRPVLTNRFRQRIYTDDKMEVPCPAQTARTLVVAIIGQSNVANSVGERHEAPANVVNFFDGKCYAAVDPLLGASDRLGNVATLIASHLADRYDYIILVPMAVGGSPISRWNGDLAQMMDERLSTLPYRLTHVLWHQGEADAFRTPQDQYSAGLREVIDRIRKHAPQALISVAVSSGGERKDPAIRAAQLAVIDPANRIVLGPDTDAISAVEDRYDGCHFSGTGARKFAMEWARLLH